VTTPERHAYRESWHVRKTTGDTSAEVLLSALRRHGASAAFTDPHNELHTWLFGAWTRGVGPAMLGLEATKEVARRLPSTAKAFGTAARTIWRAFR
jgi:hypothetical protein